MDPAPRTNYIFVDYENIQDIDLDLIAGKAVKVLILVGPHQKTLPYALSSQFLKYPNQIETIKTTAAGRNALDMVLSYHLGGQVTADPKGCFHILSKDKGFDPLITHLKVNKIRVYQHAEFAKIPVLLKIKRLSLEDRVKLVVARLEKSKANRPKRKKTLLTNIALYCNRELSSDEVQQIMDAMIKQKVIELTPTDVIVYPS